MFLLTEHLCAFLSIPTYELEPLTQFFFLKKKDIMERNSVIIGSKKNFIPPALCPGIEPLKCYFIKFNF